MLFGISNAADSLSHPKSLQIIEARICLSTIASHKVQIYMYKASHAKKQLPLSVGVEWMM